MNETVRPLVSVLAAIRFEPSRSHWLRWNLLMSPSVETASASKWGRGIRWLVSIYCGAILLSAFLLFQVQPLISRFILPWFGGSPAVWTTAMLFFQLVLFLGYSYAHLSAKVFGERKQAVVHLAILVVALACLPMPRGARKIRPGAA